MSKDRKPRWKYWKNKESWTLAEAACLANDIEPKTTLEDFDDLCRRNSKVDELFWKSVEAVQTGELETIERRRLDS